MCEHVNNNNSNATSNTQKDSSSSISTPTITSSNHSSSTTSPNNSGIMNKKRYTHNPYLLRTNSNNQQQQNQQMNNNIDNNNIKKRTPAEIELQRGLDSLLITPDAAQNFHDNNNTLHRSLIGNVSFAPYPTEAVEFDFAYYENNNNNNSNYEEDFTRVFIGQLPYRVTEMQLQWIFYVFGHGTRIHSPERITKKAKTVGNARVPTGCIHCHIRSDKVDGVLDCMHKRLLIDDSGIWYARSTLEQDLLEAYIQKLKKHPELRFPDRPYDTMVVQKAVSSYQSSQPRWVSNAPEAEKFAETTPSRKAQILYLQQQKMLKMQQQQQQQQHLQTSPAASSSSNSNNNNLNNNSYNSSTSSHPISINECEFSHRSTIMPSFNNIQQQQQQQPQHFPQQQHQQYQHYNNYNNCNNNNNSYNSNNLYQR